MSGSVSAKESVLRALFALLTVLLALALGGCYRSTPPGADIASGKVGRGGFTQHITVGCTIADGLGGPPKCASGEAEGTLIEVFPVGEAEGHFVRPEEIDRTLEFLVDGLYAVYRPVPGRDAVTYWPVGEYALLFERQIYNTSQPVTVFVQGGKIVRLGFSYPVDPAELLNTIPLDRILIPPEEAKALTEQVKAPR